MFGKNDIKNLLHIIVFNSMLYFKKNFLFIKPVTTFLPQLQDKGKGGRNSGEYSLFHISRKTIFRLEINK